MGRDADVERDCSLLRREEVRLVTLTGPGGVGKTRLALATAAELNADDRFRDSVPAVELAPVRDPALVASAIAAALGATARSGQSLPGVLMESIRDQPLLLVLDNFEHVAPAARLLGAGSAAHHDAPFPFPERTAFTRAAESATLQMGAEAYDAAWAAGRHLSIEAAHAEIARLTEIAEGAPVSDASVG